MNDPSCDRAPRWRQNAAGLVDAAAFGGLSLWVRRRGALREGGPAAWLLTPSVLDVLRQQLRTPGQLLFGTRTVDRRTGTRVALWRTLGAAGARFGGAQLVRQLTRRQLAALRAQARNGEEAFPAEMDAAARRHPHESSERAGERGARLPGGEARGVTLSRLHPAALPMLVGLVSARLRRRLAPTVEVLAGRRRDHSP